MKRIALLLVSGLTLISLAACHKDDGPETPSKQDDVASTDENLAGETVSVGDFKKLFVLNEGQMGTNNATLDFLRASDGMYVWNAYNQMNPEIPDGLGDVGNDIAVADNKVWIVVNNSGIVEVADVKNERHIATVSIPTPRQVVIEGNYAYVTSWNGAYSDYSNPSNSKNPKGVVYKIDTKSYKVIGNVEVGYQPEGLAVSEGKLFVANSGGISSTLPPTYSYDYTVSIIDLTSFKLTRTIEVAPNLKDVFSDGDGTVYVTSLGNYATAHSGVFAINANKPEGAVRILGGSDEDQYHCSVAAIDGTRLFVMGTSDEYNWSATSHKWYLWTVDQGVVNDETFAFDGKTPYGLYAFHERLAVADAVDYVNPGTVSLYDLSKGKKLWTVRAGVCPGHFAAWK